MVDASASVLARIVFLCAKGYFCLAVLSGKSWYAVTSVGLDEVDAGGIVDALVVGAVVDVVLASESLVSGCTVATAGEREREPYFHPQLVFYFLPLIPI